MRIKFFEYMNKKKSEQARTNKSRKTQNNETNIYPVAHCIAGKNYFPVNTKGQFQES